MLFHYFCNKCHESITLATAANANTFLCENCRIKNLAEGKECVDRLEEAGEHEVDLVSCGTSKSK